MSRMEGTRGPPREADPETRAVREQVSSTCAAQTSIARSTGQTPNRRQSRASMNERGSATAGMERPQRPPCRALQGGGPSSLLSARSREEARLPCCRGKPGVSRPPSRRWAHLLAARLEIGERRDPPAVRPRALLSLRHGHARLPLRCPSSCRAPRRPDDPRQARVRPLSGASLAPLASLVGFS